MPISNPEVPTEVETIKYTQMSLVPELDREAVIKFINEQGFLTYMVKDVRINSYLKSLLSLAGLLTQNMIYAAANDEVKTEVTDMIRTYIDKLHSDGKYELLAKQVMEFKLSIQIFDVFGETIKNYSLSDSFMTSESDLDRQTRVADTRLGGYGFPYVYGRRFYDINNPNAFKVDCILFAADDECMMRLSKYAEKKFHDLNDEYRNRRMTWLQSMVMMTWYWKDIGKEMDNMYIDRHTRISMDILKEKLLDYYKACVAVDFFENSPMRKKELTELQLEMDDYIENNVIPKIEKAIMYELHMGGSHDIAKMQSNGDTVFEVNGVPFCNYKALTSAIKKKLGFTRPLEYYINGKYPKAVMVSVRECLNDCVNMGLGVKFSDKYRPIQLKEGANLFLESLLDKFDTNEPLVTSLFSDTKVTACIRNGDELQLEVMRFVMEATDYSVSFRNGKIALAEKFTVDKIRISLFLSRADSSEDFVVTQGSVALINNEREAELMIETLFDGEAGIKYGALFTGTAYVKALRAPLMKRRKNANKGCEKEEE